MNRYALFAGDDYYPLGGGEDFVKTYSTMYDAMVAGVTLLKGDGLPSPSPDWADILDLETGDVWITSHRSNFHWRRK